MILITRVMEKNALHATTKQTGKKPNLITTKKPNTHLRENIKRHNVILAIPAMRTSTKRNLKRPVSHAIKLMIFIRGEMVKNVRAATLHPAGVRIHFHIIAIPSFH